MKKYAEDVPFIEIRRTFTGRGINQTRLSELLGCARQTARKKLDNPKLFTLEELERIIRAARIPAEEIRGSIKF